MGRVEGVGVRLQFKWLFKTARDLSSSCPVFQRQQAFFIRINQNDPNNRTVFGITDVGMPVLQNLVHGLYFRHADLQDAVVLKVNAFHG